MPVMTEAPDAQKKRYKMKLINDEFMEQYGNWNPAGSVIVVDEDTAVRWLENGIATQAGRDEQTAKEIRRAELLATLNPIEEDDEPPMPARRTPPATRRPSAPAATRQPLRKPTRRTAGDVRPSLVGAGVLNSLDDVPEDDGADAD